MVVVDRQVALTRALYRAWDRSPVLWEGHRVEPHFVRLPRPESDPSGFWAELALDGVVLFDRDWELSRHLARVRRAIAAGRLVRRVVHGQPYWAAAR